MSNYTLYGAGFSLYTGKARAYLNYKKIPFTETLSTAKVYKKIIIPKTGVKFIPVIKTPNDEYLQDTTSIIDQLEQTFPNKSVYPTTPKQRLIALLLELYGDEWLLIPAMHYRWNHDNFPFIYQEFGRLLSPHLPAFLRTIVGKKIGNRFKDIVPLLGITKKTIPAIERWYEQGFLSDFNTHLAKYPYLLGDVPSIGDFGFFGPLYAHLYRDPYPGALMKNIAPNVASWVERMLDSSAIDGNFLANDDVPDTLLPVLRDLFKTHWPVLEDTANKVAKWHSNADQSDSSEVPRRLGMHTINIAGVQEQRMVLAHSQWMMQRPIDYYQSLSTDEKNSVDRLLTSVGGLDAMRFKLKTQMVRTDNKYRVNPHLQDGT